MKRHLLLVLATGLACCALGLSLGCGSEGGGGLLAEVLCGNGIDDDGDGDADCGDPDCECLAACPCPEDCDNGTDDDLDDLTDCADRGDCAMAPNCLALTETDCDDGLDNDFDGLVDCADADCGTDDDGDTFSECAGDCDDTLAAIFPGAAEACNGIDDDCDGSVPGAEADADADTFRGCENDCNDDPTDGGAAINPDAQEVCDALDNDCDMLIDAMDPSNMGTATWHQDIDGDGYGALGVTLVQCTQPMGYVLDGTDCDDAAMAVNPGATEVCNDIDDDCDMATDEDCDDDNDDYCDAALTRVGTPLTCTAGGSDCDDTLATGVAVNPGATEVCNDVDDNCDMVTDEGCDDDDDNYCDVALIRVGVPTTCTAGGGDCDDAALTGAAINPGAQEVCDTLDNDCDMLIDAMDPSNLGTATWHEDMDGDGYGAPAVTLVQCLQPMGHVLDGTDCDDAAMAVNPGATEVCNDIDDDCDMAPDEDCDDDNDDFCDAALTRVGVPMTCTAGGGDCDDTLATGAAANPGATEVCATAGVDDDCDGMADEPGAPDGILYYTDSDEDGYGATTSIGQTYCSNPGIGYSLTNDDCDDGVAAVNPGAIETCNMIDDDCDMLIDDADPSLEATVWYRDQDGDGWGTPIPGPPGPQNPQVQCNQPNNYVDRAGDCTDSGPGAGSINPDAAEICDSIDNDCDGMVDDADASVTGRPTWYADTDTDGYGDAGAPTMACVVPAGAVADSTDCDDTSTNVNPGVVELCATAGVDDNCNGVADEAGAQGGTLYYPDGDMDGFGATMGMGVLHCVDPGAGFSLTNDDCNDADGSVNPGATEICNMLVDDDCDGLADDADPSLMGTATWYQDSDMDGFGNLAVTQLSCAQPAGYVANSTDCNDAAAGVNPGATEICNMLVDDDCDGMADDTDPSVTGQTTWHQDTDMDGFGNLAVTQVSCVQPAGFVATGTDCNDADMAINPGAIETCATVGVDDDCDMLVDAADPSVAGASTYHADGDADGFGAGPGTLSCAPMPPVGFSASSTDCNDASPAVNPGATEICDSIDNDCDMLIDNADPGVTGRPTWYRDSDMDGFGNLAVTQLSCTQPAGYVADSTDCADGDAGRNPGLAENCAANPAKDEDCDLLIDCADSQCECIPCGGGGKKCRTGACNNVGTVSCP